jgi:hypothetical protein
MKRRALKLLLFLFAGAIFNVAVAWGCALTIEPQGVKPTFVGNVALPNEEHYWDISIYVRPGASQIVSDSEPWVFPNMPLESLSITLDAIEAWSEIHSAESHRSDPYTVWYENASGWPTLATYSREESTHQCETRTAYAIRVQDFTLPLRPIWPGFAINTIFYAAVLWIVFAVPAKLRKWRRIKRGQCASCGYSLRDIMTEKCPECGTLSSAGAHHTQARTRGSDAR